MKNRSVVIRAIHNLLFCSLLVSCASTIKYIPEGQYLLDKVHLKMQDEGVAETTLLPFVQQEPNGSKWGVRIYNMVDNDSNYFKKFIRKMGEPSVIFNKNLVGLSVDELEAEMQNLGYLHAQVSAQVDTANKKAVVTYFITNNKPYRIRDYQVDIPALNALRNRTQTGGRNHPNNRPPVTNATGNRQRGRLIKEGEIFDMNLLEKERARISSFLRNQGYYASTRDNLHFFADTTLRSNQVDLRLVLTDSASTVPYTVKRVNVYSGYDPLNRGNYAIADSVEYKDIHIYYDQIHFLRPSVINEKIVVRPEDLYRERRGESTLSMFRALNCLGRADLQYQTGNYPDSTLLDCNIYLTPGNIHSVQAGFEGTNKAGDLGIAADVTYGHLNLFNGSEIFNVNVRAAYEFVGGNASGNEFDHNYYEIGIKPSLTFPKLHLPYAGAYLKNRFNTQTQYSLGYHIQQRPEYTRNFFNFNWKIRWTGQQSMISHALSLLDINYVSMPWKSSEFKDYLNNRIDPLTKNSYNNMFTAGINYNLIYTNANSGRLRQHLYTIRFYAETSGNVLYGLSHVAGAERNTDGQYEILGNPFAQYAKGDIDIAHTFHLDSRTGLAFHFGVGMAYPYKNSEILPFEKRYYAGGPNNVRGWNTRYLGPGSYNQGWAGDPTTHVGDINLIMNAEYRFKVLSWIEPAFFIDAGNIWTIKDYPNQPGGYFQWDSFYKELAVGTGVGVRFDWSFLILRLDVGWKVHDPARSEGDRWVLLKNRFFKDAKFYLAIGYPF
jgi:outer membrane protein assembly factor BamA